MVYGTGTSDDEGIPFGCFMTREGLRVCMCDSDGGGGGPGDAIAHHLGPYSYIYAVL